MRLNMDDTDLAEFDEFVKKHWGKAYSRKETVEVSATNRRTKKKRKKKEK